MIYQDCVAPTAGDLPLGPALSLLVQCCTGRPLPSAMRAYELGPAGSLRTPHRLCRIMKLSLQCLRSVSHALLNDSDLRNASLAVLLLSALQKPSSWHSLLCSLTRWCSPLEGTTTNGNLLLNTNNYEVAHDWSHGVVSLADSREAA